jgi:hypothetical protein
MWNFIDICTVACETDVLRSELEEHILYEFRRVHSPNLVEVLYRKFSVVVGLMYR